jgi:hypothetical protein
VISIVAQPTRLGFRVTAVSPPAKELGAHRPESRDRLTQARRSFVVSRRRAHSSSSFGGRLVLFFLDLPQLLPQPFVRELQVGLPFRVLTKTEAFVQELDDIEAVV